VSAETFLAAHTVGVFRLSFAGIGPTELRILLAVGAVAVSKHPFAEIGGRQFLLLDVSGAIATAGLGCVFVVSAIRNAKALYLEEPLPRSGSESTRRTQRTQRPDPKQNRVVPSCP
jgi:hypothetical protein